MLSNMLVHFIIIYVVVFLAHRGSQYFLYSRKTPIPDIIESVQVAVYAVAGVLLHMGLRRELW